MPWAYKDKIDGKAGMLTRAALGAYQKANGLKLDCWPTQAVLDHMQMKNPAAPSRPGPGSGAQAPIRSGQKNAAAAIADHVAVPSSTGPRAQ